MVKRRVSGLCLVLLLAALGVWWMANASVDAGASRDEERQSPKTGDVPPIAFSDTESWVGKLRTRAEVRFVRPLDPTHHEVVETLTTLTSLGPLEARDLDAAMGFSRGLLELRQKDLATHQISMSSTSLGDAYQEASLLLDVEVAMGVQECLRTGKYIVLPPGQSIPIVGEALTLGFGVMSRGRSASAEFVFHLSDYPNLASLKAYRDAVEGAHIDDVVSRFNGKPQSERRAMVERYESIISRAEKSADDLAFSRAWFSTQVVVDGESLLLMRRPSVQRGG